MPGQEDRKEAVEITDLTVQVHLVTNELSSDLKAIMKLTCCTERSRFNTDRSIARLRDLLEEAVDLFIGMGPERQLSNVQHVVGTATAQDLLTGCLAQDR